MYSGNTEIITVDAEPVQSVPNEIESIRRAQVAQQDGGALQQDGGAVQYADDTIDTQAPDTQDTQDPDTQDTQAPDIQDTQATP